MKPTGEAVRPAEHVGALCQLARRSFPSEPPPARSGTRNTSRDNEWTWVEVFEPVLAGAEAVAVDVVAEFVGVVGGGG